MMLSSRNISSRSPFTAIQWQELENQALIYKYLVSGVPIPPELITTVRRMLDPSSFSSTILYPHHYHQAIGGGWGCFDVGIGGRKADPEPGRCRRTDGKKWRCQKDAYPGSRYCERHIHRGKGKSKKQQQLHEAAASAASNNNHTSTTKTPLRTPYPLSTTKTADFDSSASRTALFSGQKTGTASQNPHLLSSDSFGLNNIPNKDYRCLYRYFSGMNDSLGERSFFPQDARTTTTYIPNTANNNMDSSSSSVGHSNFPFQGYNNRVVDTTKQEEHNNNHHHHHHSYVLGIESESVRPIKLKQDFIHTTTTNEQQENSQMNKPFHHFFDEWSRNNNSGSNNPNGCVGVSWLNDYEEDSTDRSGHVSSVPTSTQLSMAIPMASNDLSSPPFSTFHSSS